MQSGQEQRNRPWKHPRAEYSGFLTSPLNRATDLQQFINDIRAFFVMVSGQADGFRFFDPLDCTLTNEPMTSLGGGVYQLTKTYSLGGRTYIRPITKPITSSVTDYQGNPFTDAILISGGTVSIVDETTGQVTFSSVSGTPRITCQYHIPVRLLSDKFELTIEESRVGDGSPIIKWNSLGLIEVRLPDSLGSPTPAYYSGSWIGGSGVPSGGGTGGNPSPAAPTISSLSATSGVPGDSITITGTNFGPAQGTSTVTLNGQRATATAWSSTSITVTVPAGATSGNFVVIVGGLISNGVPFTVNSTAPPPVTGSYVNIEDQGGWRMQPDVNYFAGTQNGFTQLVPKAGHATCMNRWIIPVSGHESDVRWSKHLKLPSPLPTNITFKGSLYFTPSQSHRIEIDTIVTRSGKKANMSLQFDPATGNVDISDQNGSWTSTGFAITVGAAGWHTWQCDYTINFSTGVYSHLTFIWDGVSHSIPGGLQNLTARNSNWVDGVLPQLQLDSKTGGARVDAWDDGVTYLFS
jgi:uncharacterized protein (TIGR02217 family)